MLKIAGHAEPSSIAPQIAVQWQMIHQLRLKACRSIAQQLRIKAKGMDLGAVCGSAGTNLQIN